MHRTDANNTCIFCDVDNWTGVLIRTNALITLSIKQCLSTSGVLAVNDTLQTLQKNRCFLNFKYVDVTHSSAS